MEEHLLLLLGGEYVFGKREGHGWSFFATKPRTTGESFLRRRPVLYTTLTLPGPCVRWQKLICPVAFSMDSRRGEYG